MINSFLAIIPGKMICFQRSVTTAAFVIVLSMLVPVSQGYCSVQNQHAAVRAQKGIIDCSGIDFTRAGVVKLDGEWEFYWNRLLGPGDFITDNPPVPDGYYPVPLFWTKYKGLGLPARGNATYRLRIKTGDCQRPLSIMTPEIFSEYMLWINGMVIDRHGSFAEGRVRFLKPNVYSFPCHGDIVEILLQIKNYSHGNAGIGQSFFLGTPEEIGKTHNNSVIIDMILIAICIFAGCYHLVLFSFRRKEKELLYFGLFSIIIAVRTLFTGTTYIMQLFPDMPFEVGSRLATVTIPLSVITFFVFVYYFLRPLVNRIIFKVLMAIHIAYLFIIPFATTYFYSSLFAWYLIAVGLTGLYAVFVSVVAVVKKHRYAWIFLGGYAFVFIGIANDSLHYMQVINTGYQMALWFSAFIVAHSFMLAIKFANEHRMVEQLSKQLQAIDKLKDEFLANTSHELRTPLNGIIGIGESLIDGISGELPEKALQNLKVIVSSGKRLSSLINDILDFSRLRNNDIMIQEKQIDLKQLVAIVMTVVKATMSGKNIKIINDVSQDFPYVLGDEDRLQQILYNLIGNAFKFTSEGHVKVTASDKGEFAEICVEDTGIGIDPGMKEDIFKSFEQGDGSISREYGGTGLGLSITKQLIELHGGTIRVESEPNRGSRFIFTLKKATETGSVYPELKSDEISNLYDIPDNEIILAAANNEKIDQNIPGERILVVDDDWVNIQILLNYLSGRHYIIDYAVNGIDAIEKVNQHTYDIILLDIMMPKMSGFDVCRALRKKFTSYELPILILTAKNQTNDIVAAFNLGANDYLVKPFDKSELLARIETHLSLKMAVENAITNARLANIDHLTGLYNRRFFWEAGRLEFNRVQRISSDLSVLMLDIDIFKAINDSYGHHLGDKVIKQVSLTISRNVRGVDIPGRYGGEEFIVILPGTGHDGAMYVAEKIRKITEQEKVNNSGAGPITFTVSIGVASYHKGMADFEELVQKADEMLYRAKENGRNRVEG